MVISQKCNCCEHESVCKKVDEYNYLTQHLRDTVAAYSTQLADVSVRCPDFLSKQREIPKGTQV